MFEAVSVGAVEDCGLEGGVGIILGVGACGWGRCGNVGAGYG